MVLRVGKIGKGCSVRHKTGDSPLLHLSLSSISLSLSLANSSKITQLGTVIAYGLLIKSSQEKFHNVAAKIS